MKEGVYSYTLTPRPQTVIGGVLFTIIVVVAVLHFAQDVLMPLALAVRRMGSVAAIQVPRPRADSIVSVRPSRPCTEVEVAPMSKPTPSSRTSTVALLPCTATFTSDPARPRVLRDVGQRLLHQSARPSIDTRHLSITHDGVGRGSVIYSCRNVSAGWVRAARHDG